MNDGFPPPPLPAGAHRTLSSAYTEALSRATQFIMGLCDGNCTLAIAVSETLAAGFRRAEEQVYEKQAKALQDHIEHLKRGGKIQ